MPPSKTLTAGLLVLFAALFHTAPGAFNTYDSLGEAYLEAGNRELAIASSQKALALNPASENAQRMLRRLGVDVGEVEKVGTVERLA